MKKDKTLAWISLGVGLGMLTTSILLIQHFKSRRPADPRKEKIDDLIKEAEALLAKSRAKIKS
jgi:hypothetical protein